MVEGETQETLQSKQYVLSRLKDKGVRLSNLCFYRFLG